MKYPKRVRRFFIGKMMWKARRKVWGFCCGEIHPRYMWERAYFYTYEDAVLWQQAGESKPEPRYPIVRLEV